MRGTLYVLSIAAAVIADGAAPAGATDETENAAPEKANVGFRLFAAHDDSPVPRWFRKKPQHASPVPFRRTGHGSEFTCKLSGYFADPKRCDRFYDCMAIIPGHFDRLEFKCLGGRVYSIEKGDCVPQAETDRPECSGKQGESSAIVLKDERTAETDSGGAGRTLAGEPNLPPLEIRSESDRKDDERVNVVSTSTTPVASETTDRKRSEEETAILPTSESPDERRVDEVAQTYDIGTTEDGVEETSPTRSTRRSSRCSEEGFFGDPEDCSRFHRCVPLGYTFVEYGFSCPRGTIWDDRLKSCNFRSAVERIACGRGERPTVESEIEIESGCPVANLTAAQTLIVCPTSFRRHPKYCNAFYRCTITDDLRVNVTSLVCPENTIFDEKNARCVEPTGGAADCAIFHLPERLRSARILTAPSAELCPGEGMFPYGKLCSSSYVYCRREERGSLRGYLFDCPRGQVYSSVFAGCVPSLFLPFCMLPPEIDAFA